MKHFKIQKMIIDAVAKGKAKDFTFSSNYEYVGACYKGYAFYYIEQCGFCLDFSSLLLEQYNVPYKTMEIMENLQANELPVEKTNEIIVIGKTKMNCILLEDKKYYFDNFYLTFAGLKYDDLNYTISHNKDIIFAYDDDGIVAAICRYNIGH